MSRTILAKGVLPDGGGGVAEPGPVVAEQHRLDLAPDPRVIGVEPVKLPWQQLLRVDETAVERNERKRFKSHHLARPAGDLLQRRHQHESLEPDAVMAFEV